MMHPHVLRRVTVLTVTVAFFMLPMQSAFAWTVSGSGAANSFAGLLQANDAPSTSVSSGNATVSWSAVTVAGSSTTATGYTVNRVWRGSGSGPNGQQNGDKESAGGSCAGTLTALNCTSPHGPGQTWAYTITPLYAGWIGTESPESIPATQSAAPQVTGVTQENAGTLGVVNAGDSFTITFSEVLDPQSICSGFTPDVSAVQTATGMTFSFAGNPNVISITGSGDCGTANLGSLQVGGTGNGRYTQGGQTLHTDNSTLTWDPATKTITVTFGPVRAGDTTSTGASATAVFTPGALTGGGLPVTAGPVTSATDQRF